MDLTAFSESIRFNRSIFSILFNRSYLIRREIRASAKKFSKFSDGQILDFGCGSMPYEYLFHHCEDYLGLDYEQDEIMRPARKVDVYYNGVTIPFPNDRFDTVLAFEVFEHIVNLEEIFSEITRILKPDGMLCFTVPFLFPYHETPYDYQRLTSWKWHEILVRFGFNDINIVTKPNDFTSLVQLIQIYILSLINPRNNSVIELLLMPINLIFNLVGLLGSKVPQDRTNFPLSIEVIARKIK